MNDLDPSLLDRLAADHGEAFYLLDLARFEANCTTFRDALRRSYPNSNFAYSYKTNYLPALCRAAQRLGGYAEVVSAMEYDLARRLGVPPERIVFNGPYKPQPVLERALLEGAVVNVDSPLEVLRIEELARHNPGRSLTVGLRCNFDAPSAGPSRFGLDVESAEFADALRRLRGLAHGSVAGLHCHFCTPDKSLNLFAEVARRMIELARRHFGDPPPSFVNVGGGFFSPMPEMLRRQFACAVPSFREYADVLAPPFAAAFPDGRPELIVEPGISVVADAMRFVARVVEVKSIRGRDLAVVAGSVYNVQPTKSGRNLPLHVVPSAAAARGGARPGTYDVVGYTCMEDDVLFHGWSGALAIGDWVVCENVGAYTTVLKPPFIFPCPPILAREPGATHHHAVKREETAADVFATYRMD